MKKTIEQQNNDDWKTDLALKAEFARKEEQAEQRAFGIDPRTPDQKATKAHFASIFGFDPN